MTRTGYFAARACAIRGADVLVLNRQSERADKALASLKESVPGASITQIECDLQSLESVRAAARAVANQLGSDGLDVLANNAGCAGQEDRATADGYDVQMQTNHLSHFLLAKELMPLLEKAVERNGEARVVNHTSAIRVCPATPAQARYYGKHGGDLGGNTPGWIFSGAPLDRYQQSKLANVLFTMGLHERLQAKGSKVKALVANPGLCLTSIEKTAIPGSLGANWLQTILMNYCAQSAADGAVSLLTCMVGPNVQSGQLWEPKGMAGMPVLKTLEPICADKAAQQMCWEESEKACGAFFA